ncbi:MAG: glycosyltransferase [Ilumatobacteraceae bacterium]
MSRVAIYNLYWHTYGGGEQVSGAIAECLVEGHEVTLLGPVRPDVEASRARLGVDLSKCEYMAVMEDDDASNASAEFDVFINGTYRSRARNHARRGVYYVHFPEPLPTSREQVRSGVARLGLTLLGRVAKSAEGDVSLPRVKRALLRRRRDLTWVDSYSVFMANSDYTAGWVERLWGRQSTVVYPAVRAVVSDVDANSKAPLIASIGRFFDPALGHSKKQQDMLTAFTMMHEVGRTRVGVDEWRLAFVGGADAASREYTLGVRRAARDLPVDVFVNKPRDVVERTLRSASIYWHGTGYGEQVAQHPERFEHFGIAVVEAMLAGCVPLVFGEAGPAEIVRHGVDGYHWHTLEQLAEFTYVLMTDPAKRRAMAKSAVERGREFSLDRFRGAISAVVD